MGHKGLFVERLDAPPVVWFFNDDERLAPEADLLVLMRNRQYLPRLGRFLQPDPNATGVAVQLSLAYGGSALPAPAPYIDLNSWAADGTSALTYALSDPVNGADPTGLFFSVGDVLGASSWQSDLQEDAMDEYSDIFESVRDQLQAYYDSVSLDQMADFDWATNWDEPDDFYIGSAEWSSGTGSWAAFNDPYRGYSPSGNGPAVAAKGFGKGSSTRLASAGVYVLIDETTNEVVYVGRSNDIEARIAQHKRKWNTGPKPRIRGEVLFGNLNYAEMRGLEQIAMDHFGTLKKGPLGNKIRGVGRSNRNAGKYLSAARDFLRKTNRVLR